LNHDDVRSEAASTGPAPETDPPSEASPSATSTPTASTDGERLAKPKPPRSWKRVLLKTVLTLLGIALLGGFLWGAGPAEVARNIRTVGWGFFWLVAVALAWRACATTGSWILLSGGRRVSWGMLFLVRSAGESVNMLSFFGNVAGEPIKAMLLKRHLGGAEATGFVLLDKTVFYLASMVFMVGGVLTGVWVLADTTGLVVTAIALIVPWLAALSWIVWRQYKGDFVTSVMRVTRIFRVRLSDKTVGKLRRIDTILSDAWRGKKSRFYLSFIAHLMGRLLRAADVWVCVILLGGQIHIFEAYFAAASGMLSSASFVFIPGSLGAFEGGHAFVFEAIGLGFSAGVTVGIIRRIRNYFIASLGYLLLVLWPSAREDAPSQESSSDGPSPDGPSPDVTRAEPPTPV
jgi:glycosyltransferase 2 family protein